VCSLLVAAHFHVSPGAGPAHRAVSLDRKVIRYGLALALPGLLFALFHVLLVAGVIPENIQPCTQGVPCSETVIEWFGFVTIPLLSVVAFSTIAALLIVAHLRGSQ